MLLVALAGCLNPEGPIDRTPDDMPSGAMGEDGSWDLAFFGVDDDPFQGDPDAAVQVVAYDAPGCPNCRAYHEGAYNDVKTDYIDTGRIGYHYLQYRVGYPYDISGGIAEECAYREGGSDAYVDAVGRVFDHARDEDALPDILRALAADHGLDEEALISCYENEETRDEVFADVDAGRTSGAGSNPGFAVLGPDGFVEYVRGSAGPGAAIEEALAAAQS